MKNKTQSCGKLWGRIMKMNFKEKILFALLTLAISWLAWFIVFAPFGWWL